MMRNQIPPVRMAILTSLQTINGEESLEEREPPPLLLVGMYTGNASLMDSFPMPEKNIKRG